MRTFRLVVAFSVLPPLCGLIAFLVYAPLWSLTGAFDERYDPAAFAPRVAVLAGVLGVAVTVAGAVPVVSSLRGRKAASWSNLLKAGVILGNAPFLLYALMALVFTVMHWFAGTLQDHLSPASELLLAGVRMIALGSILGTVSAHVFWSIGIAGTDMAATDPFTVRK